ncbi:MAG: lytic murein transglycosylase, partial [Sphingomonas bacterium]|uniref:lytic murein transglycosylase n=1 Tax=Sphingomonas bacterium TaxID=1895847 RepID=UPI002634AD0F
MLAYFKMMIAGALLLAAGSAVAQDEDAAFQAYLSQLRAQAIAAGVRPSTVDGVLPTLTLDPQTIRNDRAQPAPVSSTAFTPFAPYRARHVNADRVARGQQAYRAQAERLATMERRTGVPASIAAAIWGHETDYGANTGRYDLFRSLATLAYEGRRRSLFAGEFVAALKMLDRGVPRARMRGSWA